MALKFTKNGKRNVVFVFNPRSAGGGGGGGKYYSLPYFLDSSKTTVDTDVKLSVPYSAPSYRLVTQFSKNPLRIFEKMAF